jgi:hypothetical protein
MRPNLLPLSRRGLWHEGCVVRPPSLALEADHWDLCVSSAARMRDSRRWPSASPAVSASGCVSATAIWCAVALKPSVIVRSSEGWYIEVTGRSKGTNDTGSQWMGTLLPQPRRRTAPGGKASRRSCHLVYRWPRRRERSRRNAERAAPSENSGALAALHTAVMRATTPKRCYNAAHQL